MNDNSFLTFVLDQLQGLGEIHHKRMFGGVGLYHDGLFFAALDPAGRLAFKVDDSNRGDYEAAGMEAFRVGPEAVLKSYYEVPIDVLEDAAELCVWARRAVEVQRRASVTKTTKKKKGRGAK